MHRATVSGWSGLPGRQVQAGRSRMRHQKRALQQYQDEWWSRGGPARNSDRKHAAYPTSACLAATYAPISGTGKRDRQVQSRCAREL